MYRGDPSDTVKFESFRDTGEANPYWVLGLRILITPWPLVVFRYRLFRLYLSTDYTSMLNLPMSTHKKIRKENRACYFTSHLYRVSSPSLSHCCSPAGLLIEHDPVGAIRMGIGMNLMHHSGRIAIPGMIPSFTHIQIECFLYAQAQKCSLKL